MTYDIDQITDLKAAANEIMGVANEYGPSSRVSDSQSILTYVREHFFTDDEFDALLDEIELFIDVNEGEFELSDEIVAGFVEAAGYVRNSDFGRKEELLILLLASLDILD